MIFCIKEKVKTHFSLYFRKSWYGKIEIDIFKCKKKLNISGNVYLLVFVKGFGIWKIMFASELWG